MRVNPSQLQANLQRSLAPVYLVAGPELLLVTEACDQIRAACLAAGVSERIVLHAEGGFDWQRLNQATETGSLFASRRLIDLRMPSGKPGREGGAMLREWVEQDRDDILLLSCQQWALENERNAWFKALDGAGIFVPAWAVKPHQLPVWLAQRMKIRGLETDEAGVRFLAGRLEGNLLAAAQEIDRLALLHGQGPVTLAQLQAAVADNARFDAFRLVELVLLGRAADALRCVRALAAEDMAPAAIVAAVAREVGVLQKFIVHGESAFRELKVWESRQKPVRAAAGRLAADDVAQALARLAVMDCVAKGRRPRNISGGEDFWQHLERFVLAFCVPHRKAA